MVLAVLRTARRRAARASTTPTSRPSAASRCASPPPTSPPRSPSRAPPPTVPCRRAGRLGEVGLAGDVRPVSAVAQRLAEAARLGFTSALVPPGVVQAPDGMTVTTVDNLGVAVTRAFNRGR